MSTGYTLLGFVAAAVSHAAVGVEAPILAIQDDSSLLVFLELTTPDLSLTAANS